MVWRVDQHKHAACAGAGPAGEAPISAPISASPGLIAAELPDITPYPLALRMGMLLGGGALCWLGVIGLAWVTLDLLG